MAMCINEEAKYTLRISSNKRVNYFNMLNEFLLLAYENAALYKLKMKNCHDQRTEKRDTVAGDVAFLFNSRLHSFLG